MSHLIYLGQNFTDKRQLIKNFSSSVTCNCDIYENCSVVNPRLVLDWKDSYSTYNYAYIPDWQRYYFITNISVNSAKRAILTLHCDVLSTYSDQISNLTVEVQRQQNKVEPYLPDNNYIFLNTYDVIQKLPSTITNDLFPSQSTTNYMFILGVSGNSNTHQADVEGYTLLESAPSDYSTRFMFYWVNKGNPAEPQMEIIGNLITTGEISSSDASNFSVVQSAYGGVYQKNQEG